MYFLNFLKCLSKPIVLLNMHRAINIHVVEDMTAPTVDNQPPPWLPHLQRSTSSRNVSNGGMFEPDSTSEAEEKDHIVHGYLQVDISEYAHI